MNFKAISASVFLLAAAAAPACAERASSDGAKALMQQFTGYFGPFLADQGIVAIEPKGDEYLVSFDGEKAFGLFKLAGAALKMEPFTYFAKELPNGGWSYRNNKYPAIAFHVPTPKGDFSGIFEVKGHSMEGSYTPNLPEIFQTHVSAEQIDAKFRFPELSGPGGDVELRQSGMVMSAKGTSAADGAVSVVFDQTIKSTVETVVMTPTDKSGAPSGAPVKVTYDFGAISGTGSIDALRMQSIGALWKWLIAHKDGEKTAADAAELKALLMTVLPLWNNLAVSATLNDVKLEIPQGSAAVKSLSESIALSGFNAEGSGGFALKFDGLSAKSPLLPPWSAPLMPAALDFNMKFTVAGLDQIARVALEEQDMMAKPPMQKATEEKIAAMFMSGSPKITLSPGHFAIPLIDIGYEGEFLVSKEKPFGHFVFSADGFDKTISFLQKNTDKIPNAQGAMVGITYLKGLAKTEAGGKLVWVVDIADERHVTVNGQPMPMGK